MSEQVGYEGQELKRFVGNALFFGGISFSRTIYSGTYRYEPWPNLGYKSAIYVLLEFVLESEIISKK